MANEPIKGRKEKGVYSGWQWLLWWEISPEELGGQVENYKTLKIYKSARGISFLCCIATVLITWLLVFLFKGTEVSSNSAFFEGFFMFVLGFFIYKGQRWAIIIMMILWTLEKSIWVYEGIQKNNFSGSGIIMHIIWWCLYMHVFYVALKVENIRRRAIKAGTTDKDNKNKE